MDADPKETLLFRAALGNRKVLSDGGLSANDMRRLLKRRLKDAGLPPIFSPHSFRVLVVTDLFSQDVALEDRGLPEGVRKRRPGHPAVQRGGILRRR